MIITIFDFITGQILRNISGPEKAVLQNVNEGEAYIEGEYPLNGKVVDGTFQAKTEPYPEYPADTLMDAVTYLKQGPVAFEKALMNTGVSAADIESVMQKHYQYLRSRTYPRIEDYLDAQVKIHSDDPATIKEGQAQLKEYSNKCLAIKAKYKKPNNLTKGV